MAVQTGGGWLLQITEPDRLGGKMVTVLATNLRVGMVVLGDDGVVHRVDNRELCLPTTVRLMVALTVRNLDTGAVHRLVRPADEPVELAALPERELECLYLTDSGCVLFDPASCEQYDTAQWVALGLAGGLRSGQRLVAGFWRGHPVILRPAPTELRQAGQGGTEDRPHE